MSLDGWERAGRMGKSETAYGFLFCVHNFVTRLFEFLLFYYLDYLDWYRWILEHLKWLVRTIRGHPFGTYANIGDVRPPSPLCALCVGKFTIGKFTIGMWNVRMLPTLAPPFGCVCSKWMTPYVRSWNIPSHFLYNKFPSIGRLVSPINSIVSTHQAYKGCKEWFAICIYFFYLCWGDRNYLGCSWSLFTNLFITCNGIWLVSLIDFSQHGCCAFVQISSLLLFSILFFLFLFIFIYLFLILFFISHQSSVTSQKVNLYIMRFISCMFP